MQNTWYIPVPLKKSDIRCVCDVSAHGCTSAVKTLCHTVWGRRGSFLSGEKNTVGRLADILANIKVISLRQAKHHTVCLLTPHKRTVNSVALTHKQKQTFPLLFRLLSFFFFFFYFCPIFFEPRKVALTKEQAWRSSDHTQSSARTSSFLLSLSPSSPPFVPPCTVPLFYMVTHSISLLFPSCS